MISALLVVGLFAALVLVLALLGARLCGRDET